MNEEHYEDLTLELSNYTVDGEYVYHVSTQDGELLAVIDKPEDWEI